MRVNINNRWCIIQYRCSNDNSIEKVDIHCIFMIRFSKVDFALNGDLGLELIKNKLSSNCCKRYKLIFLDIEMPGKNGYETFELIK